MTRTCWIIAGPNGAGKTTFALEYLPTVVGCSHFINADLIAAGLDPLAPERELEARIVAGEDFAFETTLADRTYLRMVDRLRRFGWWVDLIYLALPSAEMSNCASPSGWPTVGTPSRRRISSGASRAACATC
jgi:predicted ABC-type ATPase